MGRLIGRKIVCEKSAKLDKTTSKRREGERRIRDWENFYTA